ncbi:MAG TPA: serine/threonine-protein kinase [Planctomycetaceae bacterium]|nr:serine/threonine-protein kinase [Planctomycetaceae bacterium]
MSDNELDQILEVHLAGGQPSVPDHLRPDFNRAVAGYAALQHALGETVTNRAESVVDRPPPELPTDYEVVRELGRGGMGIVYLVRQKSLGRMVAVKVLRPGEATLGRMLQRFLEEARHLARLRHPNIVSVHEVGRAGDEPYFTMDYVEGEPLSALLARERLSPTQALALWKQAAEAVLHAHAQGIIHRDLKPGNVLVDAAGRAYVTDFGLARDMTQSSQITRTGEVMGTPAYMAPEQALGQIDQIGEATDVHALGAVLYEMLTGEAPYGKDAPANVLIRLLKEEPQPLRRIDKRIPVELETICLKALAKVPSQRYATVRAFLEDVHRFESGTPVLARRPGIVQRAQRVARQHWKTATWVTATAAVMLALTSLAVGPGVQDLLVAGDERHAGGEHAKAVGLYRRALQQSFSTDRVRILERLLRCSQEMGDREAAVDAGVELLQWDPEAWLGEYDYPVAQAVLERKISISDLPFRGGSLSTAELAINRLDAFLRHPHGTAGERLEATDLLVRLRQSLGKEPQESLAEISPTWTLPDQSPEDLLTAAEEPGAPVLKRTEAAYAAGVIRERAGDRPGALAAYRRAFDLLQATYPVYAGTNRGIESFRPHSLQWESPEPKLLRHLARTIHRLDSTSPELLRGGLRFRIAGVDLSPDLGIKLGVSLWDPEEPDPGRAHRIVRGQTIPEVLGEAPVQLDQTAWVGVADGRYRLMVDTGSRSSQGSGQAGRQYNMLEFDFSDLPEMVEIRGHTVELPAIRAKLVEVLDGLSPEENGSIDPQRTVFQWDAFPLAESYRVTIWRTVMTEGGGVYFKESHTATVSLPQLRLADLPGEEAHKLGLFQRGSTGAWSVEAFDGEGRWLARSRAQRAFVVSDGSLAR